MDTELLIRDALLYIIIVFVSYGVGVIGANFTAGLITLLAGAGLAIVRMVLKKYGYEVSK